MTPQNSFPDALMVAPPYMNVLRRTLVAKLQTLGVVVPQEKVHFYMDTALKAGTDTPHFMFTVSLEPDVLLMTRNHDARAKGTDLFRQLSAHLEERLGDGCACHVTTANHLPNGVSFMLPVPVDAQTLQQAFGDFFKSEALKTQPFFAQPAVNSDASKPGASWASRADASRADSASASVVR